MRRLILILLVFVLVLLGAGLVMLGAFPPSPVQQEVRRVLPNDRFGTK
jgi:hypothetical protein